LILVDSSVWIDYFRAENTPQVALLDELLGRNELAVGDLILAEILQGVRSDSDFRKVRKTLESFTLIELAGIEIAIKAAQNFRTLRKMGITVRKTIDSIIATRCIEDGLTLLHSDKDFLPFSQHLGLRVAYAA
jgi:predicted nucleic acid-binding protein